MLNSTILWGARFMKHTHFWVSVTFVAWEHQQTIKWLQMDALYPIACPNINTKLKKYFDLIVDFPLSFFLYLAARASSQEAKNTKTDTEK